MIGVVILLKLIIPLNVTNRIGSIFYVGIISVVGALIYFIVSYKMGLFEEVLGKDFYLKIKRKFKRNKKEV